MADSRPQPTIIMTPPANSALSHPRRPPAHRSVSLLHSPRRRQVPLKDRSDSSSSDSNPASNEKNSGKSDSPSSLQPLGRASSGESSNADKWFDKSNNDVHDNTASFADNDPPFFLRNSSSSETPPDVQQQIQHFLSTNDGTSSLPLRPSMMHLGTDGSSTEDYRGVIDDLTIENKKLKRRLKKYEKLHDSHLRDEKLFEVRIHGLPPDKKRELEETLRKFASSLGTSGFPSNGYEGLLPALNKQTTTSSQTSLQNTDSAYASMSASGQGSSAQSGNETTRYKQQPSTAASRRQNIHSYLHHIPEGLLPQQNPANMTERAKKRMIVRRLEQIFAGKGAALNGHQQSIQQQDVSQMAAHADKMASEAQGVHSRQEGTREAHIMRQELEDPADQQKREGTNAGRKATPPIAKQGGSAQPAKFVTANSGDLKGAEQRPTRPLDLDPHRAQVPADNLRYIRHLGFSPLDADSEQTLEEGHGWIYLNLLINMAQLHTIHVTSDFVRKALSEYSSKFEISNDGRKVRWKGGRSVTRTSSSGGGSSYSRATINTPNGESPRKRPKLTHRTSSRSAISQAQAQENKLMYTPLFFHKDSTDEADDSSEGEDDSGTSPFPAPNAGDSSGMTSSGVRTTSTKKPKREDGPIIFYNNAKFCTDLSGDRKPNGNVNAPLYTPVAASPVGKPQQISQGVTEEKKGQLSEPMELPEPMDLSDNPIPESLELNFPPRTPPTPNQKRPRMPINLEVTGIGGVWPADNFAIYIESRHARVEQDEATAAMPEPVPHKFAHLFKGSSTKRKASLAVCEEIVSAKKQDLPSSDLPPALSFMPSDDSYEDDDEDDDGMSVSPESPGAMPPSAAPQPVELHYTSSDEDEEYDEDDDNESDGSLDLLAAARELDPEAIREQEREYDANMAERLAEEIPAGSSAATAGGGSGYASPASGVDKEEYRKAMRQARQRPAELKRAKTSDSTKVQNLQEESSDEEDAEMSDVAS